MHKSPILSIIIPVYNGANYIRGLVESIEVKNADIINDIEIVIIIDGSTDDSAKICGALMTEFHNILLFEQENAGIAAARNNGLSRSRGTYVTFCDQDDTLYGGYNDFIHEIDSKSGDILVAGFQTYNNKTHVVKPYIVTDNDVVIDASQSKEVAKHLIMSNGNSRVPSTIWNCIFRRSFLTDNHISIYTFVDFEDDWGLMVNSFVAADKAILCHRGWYIYHINEKSESHTNKVIPLFFCKRKKLLDFIFSKLSVLPVSRKELSLFRITLNKRSVLWTIYNASYLSYKGFLEEISFIDLSLSEIFKVLLSIRSPKEFGVVLLFLLKQKHLLQNVVRHWHLHYH